MANYRGGRINEEVKREISTIIRSEIKDPRLTAMVSVTDVKVTKDLRYAKVFVSIFGKDDEEKNNTFVALKNASGYIRKEIGQIGKEILVKLFKPIEKQKELIGTLEEYNNNEITIKLDDKSIKINLKDIAIAKTIFNW